MLGYAGRLRLGPAYLAISAAALLLFVVDLVYFRQLATDSYAGGTLLDAGWAVVMLMMSTGAQLTLRRPTPEHTSPAGFNVLTVAVTVPALLLLMRGSDHAGGAATVACAAAAILLLAIRLLVTLAENQRHRPRQPADRLDRGRGDHARPTPRAGSPMRTRRPARCSATRPRDLLGQPGHDLTHHSHAERSRLPD